MIKKYWFVAIIIVTIGIIGRFKECPNKDLSRWIGRYEFNYTFPHYNEEMYYVRAYELLIFQKEEEYYAYITADGWQIMTQLFAKVEGNGGHIYIQHKEILNQLYETPEFQEVEDNILFELIDIEGEIQTVWHPKGEIILHIDDIEKNKDTYFIMQE